ncbi:MAG: hypothetical protein PHS46_01590 [Candidatus Omnitrophica bacterium]|jgi:hypothetical protein|nr:hypothetical protein [Candidatus Omnitrophota bacterium]
MRKDELRLPVGKFPEKNGWLPMAEYVEFVNFCANNFPVSKVSAKEEVAMHVNVPFSLK